MNLVNHANLVISSTILTCIFRPLRDINPVERKILHVAFGTGDG